VNVSIDNVNAKTVYTIVATFPVTLHSRLKCTQEEKRKEKHKLAGQWLSWIVFGGSLEPCEPAGLGRTP